MDARIGWTLSAVSLVVLFLGARYYVGQALERDAAEAPHRAADPIQRRPVKPPPERKPDELAALKDITIEVMSLEEDGSETALESAHAALARVSTMEVEWNPGLAKRANDMMSTTDRLVGSMEMADEGIKAHVLATWAELGEMSGRPDEEVMERLAAMREANPDAFSWE